MAYYYVKNGGTASGDAGRYASQQAGTFAALGASGYYDNTTAAKAATTAPVAEDFILISDLHDFTAAGTLSVIGIPVNNFYMIAVDDANIDAARTSGNRAREAAASAQDAVVTDTYVSGIEIFAGDDHFFAGNNIFIDSVVSCDGINDVLINSSGDGCSLNMVGGELNCGSSAVIPIVTGTGMTLEFVGITLVSTVDITNLSNAGFVNGGGHIYANGCDFTPITGTLIANVGASEAIDDLIDVKFDMCKLASGVAFTNETFKSYNQRALFTRCSDSSAAAEYQYHLHAFGGDVDDDSAIFRNESPVFTDSNQKISYKIVTNSDASLASPLWFDMPLNKWSPLSVGVTDTLRFYITSNTALTDKDIYIEISYPDGTNKQTPNFLSSAPTTVGGTLDLMAAGTTLTTDATSTWTGALSNLYQIDLDTSIDVGADTYPIIKVYVTIPSTTIQIAMDFTPL